ncbi:MAG: ADP-ribosylglycohydrolase family protein [Armatimonadota bacterium]|nr:ADP-ribosylglycohydrolase family protein [Armatimonadota bacterium]
MSYAWDTNGLVQQVRAGYQEATWLSELPHFQPLFLEQIASLPKEGIPSGEYGGDTLEASVWWALNSHPLPGAVLEAVNLGGDPNTTGIVTGGLAEGDDGLNAIREG